MTPPVHGNVPSELPAAACCPRRHRIFRAAKDEKNSVSSSCASENALWNFSEIQFIHREYMRTKRNSALIFFSPPARLTYGHQGRVAFPCVYIPHNRLVKHYFAPPDFRRRSENASEKFENGSGVLRPLLIGMVRFRKKVCDEQGKAFCANTDVLTGATRWYPKSRISISSRHRRHSTS